MTQESPFILNMPVAAWRRAKKIDVAEDHKALKALDAGLEVVLVEQNLYLAADHAAALGNAWADTRRKPTSYFSATDWHRYAKNDISPVEGCNSFREFLEDPELLIVVGLSYMKTRAAIEQMDDVLHQRVMARKVNLIAGWNIPEGEFHFVVGQEMAADSQSAFPLLHQRACRPQMALQIGVA